MPSNNQNLSSSSSSSPTIPTVTDQFTCPVSRCTSTDRAFCICHQHVVQCGHCGFEYNPFRSMYCPQCKTLRVGSTNADAQGEPDYGESEERKRKKAVLKGSLAMRLAGLGDEGGVKG